MLGTINLVLYRRDEDDTLGSDTAVVIVNAHELAVLFLGLFDVHSQGKAEVDVQFLRGAILHVEEFVAPFTRLLIEFPRPVDGCRDFAVIINVHTGLKEERLGQNGRLAAAAILEGVVMR